MVLGFVSLFRMLFMMTYFSNPLIMGLEKKNLSFKIWECKGKSNKSLLGDQMVNHIIRAPLEKDKGIFQKLTSDTQCKVLTCVH